MIDLSFRDKKFKLVEKFFIFLLISVVIIITGFVFMIVRGMNIGVEFGGGANISVTVHEAVEYNADEFKSDFVKWLKDKGYSVNNTVQTSNNDTYEFRIGTTMTKNGEKIDLNAIDPDTGDTYLTSESGTLKPEMTDAVVNYFRTKYSLSDDDFNNDSVTVNVHAIGNQVMKSLIRAAIIAVSVAIVVMLAYIAIRFTWISGLAAILALTHDVLIMIAFTTIFYIPVNSTFIAAVITIIGYSINATIVVFDRIREIEKQPSFAQLSDKEISNMAVTQTLSRSILTTVTTLVMIVMLTIFGTASIREFAFPIIFGLIGGAYSSILLSAPIWVYLRKLFRQENKRPKQKVAKKKATPAVDSVAE